jgi:hypothetical protein
MATYRSVAERYGEGTIHRRRFRNGRKTSKTGLTKIRGFQIRLWEALPRDTEFINCILSSDGQAVVEKAAKLPFRFRAYTVRSVGKIVVAGSSSVSRLWKN